MGYLTNLSSDFINLPSSITNLDIAFGKRDIKEIEKAERQLITSLRIPPTPSDYPSCMSMIGEFRSYLSHNNRTVRTLAAQVIIKLVSWALVLAGVFFGSSKSALKNVAKELLDILNETNNLQNDGSINLSLGSLGEFNSLIRYIKENILDKNNTEDNNSINKLSIKINNTDEFVANSTD